MNFHLSKDPRHRDVPIVMGPDGLPAVVMHGSTQDVRFVLSVLNGDPADLPPDATPGPWSYVPGRLLNIVSEADGGSRLVAQIDGDRRALADAIVERTLETAPVPTF